MPLFGMPSRLAAAGLLAVPLCLGGAALAREATKPPQASTKPPQAGTKPAPPAKASPPPASSKSPGKPSFEAREPGGATPGKQRQKACIAAWRALSAAEKTAQGPGWPQFYSKCVKRLKGAQKD